MPAADNLGHPVIGDYQQRLPPVKRVSDRESGIGGWHRAGHGRAPRAVLPVGRVSRRRNPTLIPGQKQGAHLALLHGPWYRIVERAGIGILRIHDLRHSFASGGLLVGEGLPMIGKLLGHNKVQTTARYAHLANDPVKSAANRIASRIAEVAG